MRERDETQLPLVTSFGEQLDRAMANRAGSRTRSRWRALSLACAAGLVAVSLVTAPGRAATAAVGEWLGLAEPGDPPTYDGPRPRGNAQEQPISSVVVAAGRAPDGVRYEFVLERFGESPRSAPPYEAHGPIHCLNIEWPDAPGGQIEPIYGCFPELPPAAVAKAVVKPGGTIFDPARTSHVQINGLARSDVRDIRILYKDEQGAKRDARVDLARVSAAPSERTGADRSFGVFIAFLPPAWLGYGARYDFRHCPLEEQPYDPQAIEVIAYNHQGQIIARETRNNGISTTGRPCNERGSPPNEDE